MFESARAWWLSRGRSSSDPKTRAAARRALFERGRPAIDAELPALVREEFDDLAHEVRNP